MASKDTIYQVFKMLVVAYPDVKLEPETPKLYERVLGDIPDEILEAVTLDHISKSPWFPKVADLRKAASRITSGRMLAPTAGEAWGEVVRQMRMVGHSGDPSFSDPVIARTVAALGWVDLCMSTNIVADRARFIEAYDALTNKTIEEHQTLPQLKGGKFLELQALAQQMKLPSSVSNNLPDE